MENIINQSYAFGRRRSIRDTGMEILTTDLLPLSGYGTNGIEIDSIPQNETEPEGINTIEDSTQKE
jgi:hypothetical protein